MDEQAIPNGKLPAELLDELLGAVELPPEVLLGPGVGEDAAAILTGTGALVVATDPITLTGSGVGRLAVVINANDLAVTGARPRWFLATLLLPPGTDAGATRGIFEEVRAALDELGAVLVGGHTEITAAVSQTVVIGQMLGTVETDRIVATAGAGPGDVVLQVGPVPVEGAAVLGAELADRLDALDPAVVAAARGAVEDPGIAVVDPALRAAELGATAMHDPTEGGLAAGLHELARAADVAVTVDRSAVRWFEPGRSVCAELGADPWATLASGCLLATFPAEAADGALDALRREGYEAVRIGRITVGGGVADTAGEPIPWPERDELARLLDG